MIIRVNCLLSSKTLNFQECSYTPYSEHFILSHNFIISQIYKSILLVAFEHKFRRVIIKNSASVQEAPQGYLFFSL